MAKPIRHKKPAQRSFFVPNLFTSGPKNRFTIVVVTKRNVSLSEKALLFMCRASVIAVRYIVRPLEQSPRLVQTERKQIATIT